MTAAGDGCGPEIAFSATRSRFTRIKGVPLLQRTTVAIWSLMGASV